MTSVSYDPNLKEYSGSKAFPNQFWAPLDVSSNKDLLKQIGVMPLEDSHIPDALSDSVYFAVWSNFLLVGRSQRKEISSKIVSEQYDNLDAAVLP